MSAETWAVPFPTICFQGRCDGCGATVDDYDTEGVLHFENAAELRAYVEKCWDGGDDERGWRFHGERLLCESCDAVAYCAANGHEWDHHAPLVTEDGVFPERTWCQRCYANGGSADV